MQLRASSPAAKRKRGFWALRGRVAGMRSGRLSVSVGGLPALRPVSLFSLPSFLPLHFAGRGNRFRAGGQTGRKNFATRG